MLKNVPHRHFVFSIPKIIRIYFLFDRTLLKELTRIAWDVLGLYYKNAVKEFAVLDFIASICSHIPNKNEQMVRYTGYYSNVCRGKRKKQCTCESGFVIEDDNHNKGCNKSWARLIKKIYEVDPLICPKCGGDMRIIAFMEDYKIVRKILDYLGIDEFKRDRPPPKRSAVADSFDDYAQNDYIGFNFSDF